MSRFVLLLGAACLFAGGAFADAPRAPKLPKPLPLPPSIAGYGATSPACQEWSDGCQVCLRGAAGAHCSTPGIACTPGPIACKRTAP